MEVPQAREDHTVSGKRDVDHLHMALGKVHADLAVDVDACCRWLEAA